MRPSRVLRKLRAGRPATCIKINVTDARVAEMACGYGFDCIWLDNEHVPTNWSTHENMIRAAKIFDVDTLIRVARGSYSDYIRPLEMDATGIMVPHLTSVEEARQVVRMTRFHPLGRRPIDTGNRDCFFCQIPVEQYIREANEERFVCVQIEDPEVMADLDEIAGLPGIDLLFFGPVDFSQGIGKPGRMDDPEVVAARKAVAAAAGRHGKFAGTICFVEDPQELMGEGYQLLAPGMDLVGLCDYFSDLARVAAEQGADIKLEAS